jgi:capsid assembly protease
MKRRLHYVLTRVFDTPLLIHRQKFDSILSVLRPRLPMMFDEGGGFDEPLDPSDVSTADPIDITGKVAVIPIHGVLVHRATGMDAMCGMTDYQVLTRMVAEASNDPAVDAILLDIDSPGGEAHGCFEFADSIFEARARKPIVAVANEMACSAAYAIASAAHKVYVTKTSLLGSIGVIATHVDQSKADEMAGLKYTHVFAGKKKADWTEHEALGERGKVALQTQVNSMYNIFVTTVARNRGIEPETVAGTEAGLFMGKSAVVAGLADEVIPLSALSEKLQESISMAKTTVTPAAAAPKGPANPAANPAAPGQQLETPVPGEETQGEEEGDEDEEEEAPPAKTPSAKAPRAPKATVTPANPNQANGGSPILVDSAVAAEIANACTAAGRPDLIGDFIKKGLTAQQAKAQLFEHMANGDAAIHLVSAVDPNANGDEQATSMLVAGMKHVNESRTRSR